METRANFLLIGLMSFAFAVAISVFFLWLQNVGINKDTKQYLIEFKGSVQGLQKGSSTTFNGIRVGEVRDLSLNPDDPQVVWALVQIDSQAPVKPDTRVSLSVQGITGIAFIAFQGGDVNLPNLPAVEDGNNRPLQAENSEFSDIIDGVRNSVTRFNGVVDALEQIVKSNQGDIRTTVVNISEFTSVMNENSENIAGFLRNGNELMISLTKLSNNMSSLVGSFDNLVKVIDPERLRNIVLNAEGIAISLNRTSANLDIIFEEAVVMATDLGQITSLLFDTIATARDAVQPFTEETVRGAVDKINTFLDDLQTSGNSIIKITDDIKEISSGLNDLNQSIQNTLEPIKQELDRGEGARIIREFIDTIIAIKRVADTLDSNLDTLVQGINSLTYQGSKSIDVVSDETVRALRSMNEFFRELNDRGGNLLFGDSGKPQAAP